MYFFDGYLLAISIGDAIEAGINWAEVPMYLVGVVTAAVVGYLCIRLLKMIADKELQKELLKQTMIQLQYQALQLHLILLQGLLLKFLQV